MADNDKEVVKVRLPEGMSPEAAKKLIASYGKKAPTQTGDDLVIFKEIESGHNQKLRVYRDIFKDREMHSIRRFYFDEKEDVWKPAKGVTFHYEDIEDLIEGLVAMRDRSPEPELYKQGDD